MKTENTPPAKKSLQNSRDEAGVAKRDAAYVNRVVGGLQRAAPPPSEAVGDLTGEPVQTVLASVGEPSVLALRRSELFPVVPLPPTLELPSPPPSADEVPPEPITSLAQLDALLSKAQGAAEESGRELEQQSEEPDAEEASEKTDSQIFDQVARQQQSSDREYFGEQLEEEELLFLRVRQCMEELATLGNMRRPIPGEPWAAPATEERLLARVDAIAACGSRFFPKLVKLLDDRPVPDPELTWANLFLFGSIDGSDSLDQVMRLAEWAPLSEPEMADFVADALALAPHPGIAQRLRRWLADPDPLRRKVAITVLRRKEEIEAEEALVAIRDPDPAVVLAATEALGTARGEVPGSAIVRLLQNERSEVVRAAFAASFHRRAEVGLRAALELTRQGRGDFGEAAMFVAISGSPEAGDAFRQGMKTNVSPLLIQALGWLGDVRFIDPLLAVQAGEPPLLVAALERITGASLTDDQPEPEYEPAEAPFTKDFVVAEREANLSLDLEVWANWWKSHRANAKTAVRYRFGHRWSSSDSIWELEDAQSSIGDRRWSHLELVVNARRMLPFDPEAFVVRQRHAIEQFRQWTGARRSSSPATK